MAATVCKKHNAVVDAVAADLGYTTPVLWSGSLSDSTLITEEYILKMADQYFTPQEIVIGTSTTCRSPTSIRN